MSKAHKIEIEQVDNERVILTVNGHEVDVSADADGLIITLTKGSQAINEISADWSK